MADERAVYTIGHSTRTFDEFAAVLRRFEIKALLDIRKFPRSRTNPQFNEETFGPALASVGIEYVGLPELGGRRGKPKTPAVHSNDAWQNTNFRNYADYATTEPFQQGLTRLLQLSAKSRCVMMCAEALWWRCHRRIVADYLLARKIPVVHIFSETHSADASLTPFAVVERDGTLSYRESNSADQPLVLTEPQESQARPSADRHESSRPLKASKSRR